MKYGIYYAYWEREWSGNFLPYLAKVKQLGFDILEVATGGFHKESDDYFHRLREEAQAQQVILTGGYGPDITRNLAVSDQQQLRETMAFYQDMFRKMQLAGICKLGGGLYGYWPADYTKPFDKQAQLQHSIVQMKQLADMADAYGIRLGMEVLNRFEGYLLNTCEEAVAYVDAVNRNNVCVMLDTFHMNIEEDSLVQAIRMAGKRLGHLHVGEANRRPPHGHGRVPWAELGQALREIGYDGDVVMEPFVRQGGQVGKDIHLWRDMTGGADEAALDKTAAQSLAYLKTVFSPKASG